MRFYNGRDHCSFGDTQHLYAGGLRHIEDVHYGWKQQPATDRIRPPGRETPGRNIPQQQNCLPDNQGKRGAIFLANSDGSDRNGQSGSGLCEGPVAQSAKAAGISALFTYVYSCSNGRQINSVFTTKKKQRGFTLIEILLVMLITSVLVLGVNTAFRQAHMLWSRAEKQRPVYQNTRLFFDTLTEELACLYIPNIDDEQPAPFSLSVLPDGTVRLIFLTMNPVWKNTAVSNFPAKVSYEFTTNSDSGRRVLSRTEQLFSGEKAVAIKQKETILKGFSGITIQAADPDAGSLADSWKSDLQCRQIPPKAVKILLKWHRDEQTEFVFETIIKIPTTSALIGK